MSSMLTGTETIMHFGVQFSSLGRSPCWWMIQRGASLWIWIFYSQWVELLRRFPSVKVCANVETLGATGIWQYEACFRESGDGCYYRDSCHPSHTAHVEGTCALCGLGHQCTSNTALLLQILRARFPLERRWPQENRPLPGGKTQPWEPDIFCWKQDREHCWKRGEIQGF